MFGLSEVIPNGVHRSSGGEIKSKIEEAEKKTAQIKKGDHFNKAVALFEKGEYKKAIKEWKEVLKIDPAHAESKRLIEKAKQTLKAK